MEHDCCSNNSKNEIRKKTGRKQVEQKNKYGSIAGTKALSYLPQGK